MRSQSATSIGALQTMQTASLSRRSSMRSRVLYVSPHSGHRMALPMGVRGSSRRSGRRGRRGVGGKLVSYHAAEGAQSCAEKIAGGSRPPARPADDDGVNRTYAIVGAMGLLACVALSLMMQHAVDVHERRA